VLYGSYINSLNILCLRLQLAPATKTQEMARQRRKRRVDLDTEKTTNINNNLQKRHKIPPSLKENENVGIRYPCEKRKHLQKKCVLKENYGRHEVIECDICHQGFRSKELKAKHFDAIHMPLVRKWFRNKGVEETKPTFKSKICHGKFMFGSSMKAHNGNPCIGEVVASSSQMSLHGGSEEFRDSNFAIVPQRMKKVLNRSQYFVFDENKPANKVKSGSCIEFMVNEIIGVLLENVMEAHLDNIAEEFSIVDVDGVDIETLINFNFTSGFDGVDSKSLLEPPHETFDSIG